MRYLITGGCGFLGSNIAAEILKQKQNELAIYDNLTRKGGEENLHWLQNQGNFSFYQRDTRDFSAICEVVKTFKPDVIYHLAGQVAMTTSIADPRLDFETNVLGSFNVLEAIRLFSPKTTLVYSSTNKVYGDLEFLTYTQTPSRYCCQQFAQGFDEHLPLDFHSPYGCSKGAADQYMLDWARMFHLNTIVFRHSSMYGARQFGTYDQGWISWFCQQALETQKNPRHQFTISGNGKQVRDVLHAQDMIALYLAAPRYIAHARGQVFNIGGGMENSLSLLELFQFLEKELNIQLHYTQLPPRASDQKIFVADITKASQTFQWTPRIDKWEGIRLMLKWLKDE